MDIHDDLIAFFEWAVLMGVPPNMVPSFQVMQTTLRARSMIVMDMVQKVRPQQEVQLMRDNILIQRMRKLKDKEMPMSVRSFIPERYNRYETMRDTNRQIKETTEKLDRIKLQSSKMLEKIKNLNTTKAKIQKCTEDVVAKKNLLEAKLMTLSTEIEKVKEQDEILKYNAIVAPDALHMDEDRALVTLDKAKAELENFYRNYDVNCSARDTKSEAKAELFSEMRRTFKHLPNLLIYRTIHKSVRDDLDSLVQREVGANLSHRSGGADESISRNISEAYQRFIHRSTQLDSERDALRTITDNYEELYTDVMDKMGTTMPDVRKDLQNDFMIESSHLHLNEGRIQFLKSEINRNKELLRERTEKMRDMVETQEAVKEVVRKSQSGLTSMVSDMKQIQKISRQLGHMRDLTEKHLALMKGSFGPGAKITTIGFNKTKKYNTCVPDDVKGFSLVDELKMFADIPMAYLNTLDEGQMYRRYSPIHMYKPDVIRASRYAHLYTVEGFLRQVKDICNLQMYLTTLNRKREFTMDPISVDVNEIRKKEFEQNKAIYRLLQITDQHTKMIEGMMEQARIYYDFLMKTPLKNYISPCTKVEGKPFNQLENEFQLYYRMVRGVEKVHEDMD